MPYKTDITRSALRSLRLMAAVFRSYISWSALVLGVATSSWAFAAEDDAVPRRAGRPGVDFQQRLLDAFDVNKNGRLDEAERTAARAAMAKRQGGAQGLDRRELMRRFDKDGDGRLNDEERQAAMQAARRAGASGLPGGGPPDRAAMLKRFDKDGDGRLNDAERAAARAAFANRPGANRPGSTDAAPPKKPDARRVAKDQLLKEFDEDGDGKLTGDERAAARKAFEARQAAEAGK